MAQTHDVAEPDSALCPTPPCLYPHGSLHLSLSEHLATHEDFYASRIIVVHNFIALLFRQCDSHVIPVAPIYMYLAFVVGHLFLDSLGLDGLAHFPCFMLLFLECLEG